MEADFKIYPAGQTKVKDIKARILLKDPLVEKTLPRVGRLGVTIRGEACVGPGPTSSRVAVVDYQGEFDELFAAATLRKDGTGFKVRGGRLERDFAFHQVNVWATIHKTLELLEAPDVFGRRIPWAFPDGRLKVLPHAGYWENAYYDRATGALHFFYFEGRRGEMIFTCLSHDIITHELGHAVLDGLKPYYNEVSSAATAGFHEYFGDAIALTSALSHRDILVEMAGRTDSVRSPRNIVANIAQQFGSGLHAAYGSIHDAYLRSAQNNVTMADLADEQEEHRYSELMTGAYYDLLEAIYKKEMKGRNPAKGNERVAALVNASQIVRRIMLRALDYCPPVDLHFADYALAVFRADKVAYPIDTMGYRDLWCGIMQRRGVVARASDLNLKRKLNNSDLRNLDVAKIASSTTDAYDFINANRAALSLPPTADLRIGHLYRTNKVSADGYRVPQEIVVEFVWAGEVRLDGAVFGRLRGAWLPLWCGGTLVFSRDGNLLHYVLKADEPARRRELLRYAAYLVRQGYLSLDEGERGLGSGATSMNKVIATLEDGRVSLRRNAAMRHLAPKDGHSHGDH